MRRKKFYPLKLTRTNADDRINEKDIQTISLYFITFKKLKGRLNMISREMEDIKQIQVELLELKTTTSEIKQTVNYGQQ